MNLCVNFTKITSIEANNFPDLKYKSSKIPSILKDKKARWKNPVMTSAILPDARQNQEFRRVRKGKIAKFYSKLRLLWMESTGNANITIIMQVV